MSGRDLCPGEGDDPFFGLRDSSYFNRLVHGQLKTPDTANGKAQVDFREICGTRQVTVPTLWFSADGRTSAWGRYMPMGGELVHLGQRNDGTPVILSYDATATKDGSPGWSEITEAQKDGKTPGFQNWRELKRGEFDFKSSGDAYIHGSNAGVLSLYGGQAFIKCEKNAYRISSKAATYRSISNTCEMRYGNVYRKLTPVDADEVAVPPGGTLQEFLVDINQMLPGGIAAPQSKAKLHFGNILMPISNIPELSTKTGAPLRGRITIGDVANALPVFTLEIDQIGNVVWNQGPTGIMGLDMTMMKWNVLVGTQTTITSTATLDTISPKTTLTAAATFDVISPIQTFTGTSIMLGGVAAIEPLLKGITYTTNLGVLYGQLSASLAAIAASLTAAGGDPVLQALCSVTANSLIAAGATMMAMPPMYAAHLATYVPGANLSIVSKTV